MFSRHKLLAALITAPALIGAFLVAAAPAEAAGGLVYASNTNDSSIAIYGPDATASNRPLGTSFVRVRCTSSKDCTGYASYKGITENRNGSGESWDDPRVGTYFKVGHGKTAYIAVRLNTPAYGGVNQDVWTKPGGFGSSVSGDEGVYGTLRLAQSGGDRTYKVVLTNRVPFVVASGEVTGPSAGVSNVKIFQWSISGLRTNREASATVDETTHKFTFTKKYYLGFNNVWSNGGRLSIQASVNGHTREWFWRGYTWGTGKFYGGSKDIREATQVSFNKDRDFKANFTYGDITGTVTGPGADGADVDIAGAPYSMPTVKSDLRAMDYPYCANDFATATVSGGTYTARFLPKADGGTDKRYAVHVTPRGGSAGDLWNDLYGSCLNARNYFYGNANHNAFLIPAGTSQDVNLRTPTGKVDGEVHTSGFSMSTYGDRIVTLREVIPGRAVLDSPIERTTLVSGGTNYYDLEGVKPGHYWLETGRATGCTGWYPSIYPNNNLYLEGLDRGAEIWKAFTTLDQLWQDSNRQHDGLAAWHAAYDHGATTAAQNHRPSGKAGWMYRDYCKTNSAGKYQAIWVSTKENTGSPYTGDWTRTIVSVKKGGEIAGHISRGTKSNKEMLVTVYSTGGALVPRTTYTNSAGNFRIYGVAPGNYNVEVNADSWRGIGRTFTGPHTKRVSGSGAYSVGTLSAKF